MDLGEYFCRLFITRSVTYVFMSRKRKDLPAERERTERNSARSVIIGRFFGSLLECHVEGVEGVAHFELRCTVPLLGYDWGPVRTAAYLEKKRRRPLYHTHSTSSGVRKWWWNGKYLLRIHYFDVLGTPYHLSILS